MKKQKQPKHVIAEMAIRRAINRQNVDDKLAGERILAKQLGVSYMTVRKAVDNLVKQGILYKVPKKGTYVANPKTARKKTKNIAYFLDSSIKDGVSSPYYSMIFDALEKAATKVGYHLIFISDISEPVSPEETEIFDGMIVSCFPRIEPLVQQLKDLVPVVCIDNSPAENSIASVVIDNFNAVADAINYLCTLGHEQIGYICGLADSDVGRNRLAGYHSALGGNGLSEDSTLVYNGDYSFETGLAAADYFMSLERRPTAIMCANDAMAMGAIKSISKNGLSVPDDISVIGFDDIILASRITPALTTISAPFAEIAQQSIDMLVSMISGAAMDNSHVVIPGQLVIRETTAPVNDYYRRDQYPGDVLSI